MKTLKEFDEEIERIDAWFHTKDPECVHKKLTLVIETIRDLLAHPPVTIEGELGPIELFAKDKEV